MRFTSRTLLRFQDLPSSEVVAQTNTGGADVSSANATQSRKVFASLIADEDVRAPSKALPVSATRRSAIEPVFADGYDPLVRSTFSLK